MVTALLPVVAFPTASAATPPAKISFSVQPGTGAPGTALATQPTVVTTDADGSTVSSTDTIALTLTGPGGAALARAASLTCTDTSKAASGGTAAFDGCTVDHGGVFSLTARDTAGPVALKAVSEDFFVSGAAALSFTTMPGGGAAGATWAQQPEVAVVDGHGDAVATSTAHIVLGISAGTGAAGATLHCTANDVAATSGVAHYAACSVDRSGTGYQLVAIDAADALISAPSTAFSITAGTPTQLHFQQQPAGGVGGTAFATQPIVTVQDAHGNVAVGNTDTITLAIKAGTGTSGAALTCADKAAADGVAGFTACSVDRAGAGYVLVATDSAAGLNAESAPFTVASGGATRIAFSIQPGGGPGGAAFAVQPRVRIVDAGGNPVPGSVTLSVVASTGTAGAGLTCAANPSAAPDGTAVFSGCAIDRTGSNYRLRATSGSLTVDSATFDVSAGVPSDLTFANEPGNGTGGSPITTQPSVRVTDSGGNAAAAQVTLTIAPGTGTPGAHLDCASNPVSTTNGIASFSGCAVDAAGAGYRLVATAGTVQQHSAAFDVTLGPAAQLAFTTQPGGGTGGTAWDAQPVVTVQDAGGNQVRTSTSSITLTVTSGTGNGTLACTADELPATRGAARFSGCSIDRTASAYRLTATGLGFTMTSHAFAVTAGPVSSLVFTGQPGGSNAGVPFAAQPAVTLVDRGGNPTAGPQTVTLAVTPGTGTGGTLSCATDQVSADPVASYGGCAIGAAGSGYTLTATAGSRSVESAPFAVLLPAPTPLGQAPTDVPVAQTYGGRLIGVNPTSVKDGVNSATGQLTFAEKDLTVAGIGVPLVLERTYNSADTTGGSFGRGWTSLLDANVTLSASKASATVRSEDGQQFVFQSNGAGGWNAPPGARSTLGCNANTCTVTRFDGYRFTVSGGHIASYLDPNGQGLRFAWKTGSVAITLQSTAATPRVVTATLDAAGHVTLIASPTRSVGYGYSSGLLTSVTDVMGKTWTDTYGNGRLTAQTDPLGHVRRTADYDGDGRVTATTQQGSPRHVDSLFAWHSTTSDRMVLTNVDGNLQRATYTDTYVGHVLVAERNPIGGLVRYSYDNHLNLIAIQDPTGWVEELTYDAAGNLIKVVDPISSTSASVVRMTYDSAHRLLTQTDADGNVTTQVYNGTTLGAVRPPGVTPGTVYTYNAAFELVRIQTATGQEVLNYDAYGNTTGMRLQTLKGVALNGNGTLSTSDEAGNRLTSVDPRGNLATIDPAYNASWNYDAAGHLLVQTTPGPLTTTYTYNAAGDLASATDSLGTTSYSWDEASRTLTTVAPGNRASTQTFDPSGNLLRQADSTSHRTTTHAYDADGREISTTDGAGITSQYTYALNGSVVRATDSTGNELTRQYDSLNRPVREVNNGAESRIAYDPVGNVTSLREAGGAVTTRTYNSHGLLAGVTTANGTTKYAYDLATDELLSTTDPNGHVTSYTYDAIARRTSTTLNGSVTRYGYDLAGNVNDVTDPDGRRTVTTLDARNLPIRTVRSQTGRSTITVENTYDAFGRRTQMKDGLGTHHYTYDAAGNLTSAETAGGTFTYDWSQSGKIVENYPDNTKITFGLDDAQKLMSVETGTVGTAGYVQASYVRNDLEQTTALAYSNGVLETRQYDRAGNLVNQQQRNAAGPLADDTFTYDAAGNRLTQRSTTGGRTTANAYGYDATGRLTTFRTTSGPGTLTGATLPADVTASTADAGDDTISGGPSVTPAFDVTSAVDPTGATPTKYTYDAVGNRITTAASNGTTTSSTYDGADRNSAYTYDRAGNVTKIGGRTFGYDAAGHLTSVTTASSTITYQYDGDGNRISKTVGSAVTQYVWDPFGSLPQLAIERKGNGDLIRRYIYGDGPVAMQTPTTTFFFHVDPIGSVTGLTDAAGKAAATYTYDGFGNVTTVGANAPVNPLLFQGQYLDSDTGLYNMRARNYDPTTGRFTQPDPVEHAVGDPAESSYVFAADRPTVFTDPTGRTETSASTFEGKKDTAGNVLTGTKLATSATTVEVKAYSAFGGYSAAVKQAALSAKIGAELSPEAASAAKIGGKLAKVGVGLAVFGLALQVGLAINDCLTDTLAACVGSTVSTVVSIGFTVGCTFISSGIGAGLCAIAGAALSVALQQIITRFGPEIVAGVIEAAEWTAKAAQVGAGYVVQYAVLAYDAVSTFATDAGGAISAAWNDATTSIASGFDLAMKTLVDAGYAAAQLADVLANGFRQGVDDVVGALVGLGYSIAEIAESVRDVFESTAAYVADVLSKGFNYTALQIAGALLSAYNAAAGEVAKILKDVGFAVDLVAGALKDTYDLVASEAAAVLDAVGYGFQQVAGALQSVFDQTDQLAAQVLAGLGATANQVAAALRDFYADAGAAAAAALKYADYVVDEIAGALDTAYRAAAQAVAGILKDLAYGATAIAGALKDVFDTASVQAAQILQTLEFALLDVSGALKDAYLATAEAAAGVLRTIGYTATQIGTALQTTFTELADGAAAILQDVGFGVIAVGEALRSAFQQTAAEAAAVLEGLAYQIADIATALQTAFQSTAADAVRVLSALFDVNSVALVLSSVYQQSIQQIAQIFDDLAYSAQQIAQILEGAFAQAGAAVAQILKDIGVAAAEIASVLESVFNEAVSTVANLLSSIGFNNDVINSIGGAFSDFGKAVENCFTSLFTDC